jgi:hypothetical protein
MQLFQKLIIIGNKGEKKVTTALENVFKENVFIKRKFKIPTLTSSKEADILLIHPALGIFIIEVKNKDKIEEKDYLQAKEYRDLLLAYLKEKIGKIPINIEYKVFYPKIPKTKPPFGYENHTLFKEDLNDLKTLFKSTYNSVPSYENFKKVLNALEIDFDAKPIISHNQIEFFDQKQLSVLNSYKGGFRLIRGVAGSGKTVILTTFANKVKNPLILSFNSTLNKKLKQNIKNPTAKVFTLFKFLTHIGIDLPDTNDFDKKFKFISQNLDLIEKKVKAFLDKNEINYFLVDEAQDMEAGFLRMMINNIPNSLIFIDEAQKFYNYSLKNFDEVTKHPKYPPLSVKGRRTINLKNIYRTPNNIAKCALDIVKNDSTLNRYYKNINFIKEDFSNEIKLLLKEGELNILKINDQKIEEIINSIDKNETYLILTHNKDKRNTLRKKFKNVETINGSKGLEADHVIVDDFYKFLYKNQHNDIFFRQLYVILTRAKKSIYLDLDLNLTYKNNLKPVIKSLKKYQTKNPIINDSNLNHSYKEILQRYTEIFIKTGEIAGAISAIISLLSA